MRRDHTRPMWRSASTIARLLRPATGVRSRLVGCRRVVAEHLERHAADAAGLCVRRPHDEGDGVVALVLENAAMEREDALRTDVVDVLPHVPAVDEDQRAVAAGGIIGEAQADADVLIPG